VFARQTTQFYTSFPFAIETASKQQRQQATTASKIFAFSMFVLEEKPSITRQVVLRIPFLISCFVHSFLFMYFTSLPEIDSLLEPLEACLALAVYQALLLEKLSADH